MTQTNGILFLFALTKITFVCIFVEFLRNYTYVKLQAPAVPRLSCCSAWLKAPNLVEEQTPSPRCRLQYLSR